jgi:oligopeptide transport system substrate-binding protein
MPVKRVRNPVRPVRPFHSAVLCCALVACAVTAHAESVLTRGNHQDPASLDPHRISTVYEQNIVLDLFEGLTVPDAAGRPVPGVAQSWDVSEDGLRWTFTLKPGLRWSDGTPLTADDVVFSFRRLMDPATAAQYPYLLNAVANAPSVNRGEAPLESLGVNAPSPEHVIFTLTMPVPFLLELLSNGFAAIVPRHIIAHSGGGWTAPGVLVSNGAFILEDWRPQNRVDLVRNPNFHAVAAVALDRVVYLPTEDQSAALARFRGGELDTSREFPTARTPWLRENYPTETHIAEYLATFYLSFNMEHAALADRRVRQALSLAIDRDILADRVLRSGEGPAISFVPPSVAGYTAPPPVWASQTMAERRGQARQLLAAAGYGPDQPLRLTYSLSSAEDRRRVAAAIAAMWQPLGVEITLNNTEGKVLFSRLRSGDFEIGYAAWAADVNDAGNFLAILRSGATNSNYARYRNPDYDSLLDTAAATASPVARAALLADAEALLLADAPIAPLFHGVSKNLVAAYVTGWVDNPKDVHLSRYLTREEPRPSSN